MTNITRVVCLLACAGAMHAGVIASSNWDNPADGVDGWTFLNDGTNLIRVASGGNPGGFLQVTDQTLGSTMYFVAPSKFLGNQSAAYGNTLTFDVQQSFSTSPFADTDLILQGNRHHARVRHRERSCRHAELAVV